MRIDLPDLDLMIRNEFECTRREDLEPEILVSQTLPENPVLFVLSNIQ